MDKKDVCSLCGVQTPYMDTTPIHERIGYVEGAGQGCYLTLDHDKNKCTHTLIRRNKEIHLK